MPDDERALTVGELAADRMKALLATWGALSSVVVGITVWIVADPHFDRFPFVLLNLCLSCFAALQCFVLLIANRRGEQVADRIAEHTLANTEALRVLLERTETEVEQLLHGHEQGWSP